MAQIGILVTYPFFDKQSIKDALPTFLQNNAIMKGRVEFLQLQQRPFYERGENVK